MSKQYNNNNNNQNSNSEEQSTIKEDYSTQKSYLHSLMKGAKLDQSKSISKNKKTKKISDDEFKRIIDQSKVIKQQLDEEQSLFDKQEQHFYYCDYCGNEYQGRYDIDRHKKSVHPEEYNEDNPDFFQCQICLQAFHKSNCLKHTKVCGNKNRERLRQKMQQSDKIQSANKSIGDLQTYQKILNNHKILSELEIQINSLEQTNVSQQLSEQQKQIEIMRNRLKELELKKNSQVANNNILLDQSFISNTDNQFNQTNNYTLPQQSTQPNNNKTALQFQHTQSNLLLSSKSTTINKQKKSDMEIEEAEKLNKTTIF